MDHSIVTRLACWSSVLLLAGCSTPSPRPPPSVAPPVVPATLQIVAVAPGHGEHAPPGSTWLLYLDGLIDNDAATRLAAVIDRQRIGAATVYFNSPGGKLVAAMAVGRVVRSHGFSTVVGVRTADVRQPAAGTCFSACPFAFAGGVQRSMLGGSAIGVHLAANSVPVPDEAAFQQRVRQDASAYLESMGVAVELLALMSQAPHATIRPLTPQEAVRLRLINARPPQAAMSRTISSTAARCSAAPSRTSTWKTS
jgi:hypothetical protein